MLEENSLDSVYDATDPGKARFVYKKDMNAPSGATYAIVRNIAPLCRIHSGHQRDRQQRGKDMRRQ